MNGSAFVGIIALEIFEHLSPCQKCGEFAESFCVQNDVFSITVRNPGVHEEIHAFLWDMAASFQHVRDQRIVTTLKKRTIL